MESNQTTIGALIFIAIIIGANLIMYGIVRGVTRPGHKGFIRTLSDVISKSTQKKDDSMDELRRRVQDLGEGEKDEGSESHQ